MSANYAKIICLSPHCPASTPDKPLIFRMAGTVAARHTLTCPVCGELAAVEDPKEPLTKRQKDLIRKAVKSTLSSAKGLMTLSEVKQARKELHESIRKQAAARLRVIDEGWERLGERRERRR